MPGGRRFGRTFAALAVALIASTHSLALEPAAGRFLVATENLGDPNFERTVILLLDYGPRSTLGVVVNRPTDIRVADAVREVPGLSGRDDSLYAGGPVERGALLLVVRSETPVDTFERVFGEVHRGTGASALGAAIAQGLAPAQVRAYAGYAGWGPGQLDGEIERGSWYVLPATAQDVFDPQPLGLWRRMLDRSRVRFAGAVAARALLD